MVLVDGHSVLFRAFHAFPPLTTKSGELVNAVYGFTSLLLSAVRELRPVYIAVSFDRAAPTFRHQAFAGYKAHRPEAPEELVNQQDRVEEVVSVLGIPIFAIEGYEADDVIGTLAEQAIKKRKTQNAKRKTTAQRSKRNKQESQIEVVIVTGDRDVLQLVEDHRVLVYMPARGKERPRLWNEAAVVAHYGLAPKQLVDLRALSGDPSDEIPGVRGIGPKTATALLSRHQNLEGVYAHLADVRRQFGEVVYQKLLDGKASAVLSKKLAAIVRTAPIRLRLSDCAVNDYDKTAALNKFEELEFTSLIPKLPNDSFEQMVQETLFSDHSSIHESGTGS